MNAELVFVFREEGDGIEGLEKINKKHPTEFTLAIDPKGKATKEYSPGRMEFDNYVIDSSGTIRGVVDGTKTDRATAEELIRVLKQIESEN